MGKSIAATVNMNDLQIMYYSNDIKTLKTRNILIFNIAISIFT